MCAVFNLPLDKLVKRRPINFTVLKGRNQCSNRSMKHNNSFFLFNFYKAGDNLARRLAFGKQAVLFLGVTALCFGAFSVHAFESPVNRKQSDKARALTVEAVKLIEKKKWDEAQKKIAESKDPLAAKIFYWLQLSIFKEKSPTG